MKKVSMYQLKQGLASVIAEARAGQEILITRHNRPAARLISADSEYLHTGSQFGKGMLRPIVRGKTRGRYLQVLEEDRQGSSIRRRPDSHHGQKIVR